MFCLNYKDLKKNSSDKNVVQVELYSTNVPSPLPTDATGITNFPENYDPTNVVFAPGSTLYVVSTGAVYIANEAGTFVVQ